MLAKRPYMRGEYQWERTSALTWLLSAIAAGFLIQLTFGLWLGGGNDRLGQVAAFSTPGLRQSWGAVLLSHVFLHSTRFIFHAIGNGLLLYFLGRELVPLLGARRFVGLFFAASTVGALAWLAVHWNRPGDAHIGATAALCGLFVAFACFDPGRRINFLLFFIWPVTLKPRQIAVALLGFSLIGFFLHELPATALPFDLSIAHSAHLGGLLAGWVYFRFVHRARWFNPDDRGEAAPRRLTAPAAAETEALPAGFDFAPPATSPEDIRAEVDRILDKINSHGLGSLSPAERRLLDEARDNLPRR
jgi:membrane associated rhomboid family serine protease